MIRPGSQCSRVLAVLSDGKIHRVPEIHRRAGTMRLNSRVSELRLKHGYNIVCSHYPGETGARSYAYCWVDAPLRPASLEDVFVVPGETFAPRNERERFRIYRVRNDTLLELVATVATPEAVGVALCTLGAEKEFRGCTVGILDSKGREDTTGEWLVNPFDGRT